MKSFCDTVNYSAANEDAASELMALDISPPDSVLCVTGSGARVLDLLVAAPARIVAIDVNPCQSFMLELKMAGCRRLGYDEFVEFLGLIPSRDRRATYQGLRGDLSAEARWFWDGAQHMIERGILYEGRWERHFRGLARVLDLAWPGVCRRLFECHDLEDQIMIWKDRLDGPSWGFFLKAVTSRAVWKCLLRDPGFYRFVPREFRAPEYIERSISGAIHRFLLRESPFATLLFLGHYDKDGALPIHLQHRHYHTIREALPSIEIVTDSLVRYLMSGRSRFDAYSLSDIGSYTGCQEHAMTWFHLVRRASQGARICERQFLVKREPPPVPGALRHPELERCLEECDRSVFYSFVAASVGRS